MKFTGKYQQRNRKLATFFRKEIYINRNIFFSFDFLKIWVRNCPFDLSDFITHDFWVGSLSVITSLSHMKFCLPLIFDSLNIVGTHDY
jgi:hypothetical protein